ncbi:MAG: protease inhibitor I42 family protein [Gammaproteobacteria bacterium]|nr:protease inhibitor I42 family protein [Gammaproteobacteria bacterium]
MLKKLLVLFICGFFAITVFAANVTDPAKVIMVNKNKPTITIVLKSNRTTGFMWILKRKGLSFVVPISHEYVAPRSPKTVGAGGYEVWHFRVKPCGFLVPQLATIDMVYARPWALHDKDIRELNFEVVTQ